MTLSNTLISVGIPFYNEEKYIRQTIESAVNQSLYDIKVILADNCSIDSSYAMAEQHAAVDPRIELYRHSSNIGAINNFKFALSKASTKYFVWLGGHDMIAPDYLENAVKILEERPDVVMVYPLGVTVDSEGKEIEPIQSDYETIGQSLDQALLKISKTFYNGYVIHGVFRTEILKKLPFENVNAPDILIVLLINFYGRILQMPSVGFLRRMVRKETKEEQSVRHVEQGVYVKMPVKPFSLLLVAFYKHLWKFRDMSFFEKLTLSIKLKKIFQRRFKVTWRQIGRSIVYAWGSTNK